jgi:uncharacterized protein (DUF302 family)
MDRGRYFFRTELGLPFAAAVEKVKQVLGEEGFGIMAEIDVRATLKKRLAVEFRPYLILGVCHPPSAWQVLQEEEQIGLMLPCNMVVQEKGEGRCVVSAIDPESAMAAVGNPALAPIAAEVTGRLKKILEKIERN